MIVRNPVAVLLLATGFLTAGTIHLKTRDIDTSIEPPSSSVLPLHRLSPNRKHLLLEFRSPVNRELTAELAARGVAVTSALGLRGLMVEVADETALSGLGVTWSGGLRASDKLSPDLDNETIPKVGWIVEFHNDVPTLQAMRIARRNGLYVFRGIRTLPHQLAVRGQRAALNELAEWDEVAYIFPASTQVMNGQAMRPCAGALTQGGTSAQYVLVSSGWAPSGLNGTTLNYVFTTLTTDETTAQVQSEIVRAMHAWSAIANVQFVEGEDPAAARTVAIEFGTSVNNDPTPFEPGGTILAHTYYPAPPNPEPIAGDMHFNPAESWHVGANTDIYSVALHELGHALGLGHTDNPADVMYPYYRYNPELSENDIAGVVSLYGAPGSSTPIPSGGSQTSGTDPVVALPPLSIALGSPMNGSRTAATTTTLTGTLLNVSGAATVAWQTSSGQSGQATGGASWTALNVPLSPGVNLITLTASDSSGHTGAALVRVTRTGGGSSTPTSPVTVATGPVITITSPANGLLTSASTLSLSGTAAGSAGIAQVTWQTSTGASGNALGTTSWTASGIPLFAGTNVVIVRAFDSSGAMQWTSITVTQN